MKFGVRVPQDGPFASPKNMKIAAQLSENLGYDSVWIHDHVHWPPTERYHLSAGTKEAVDKAGRPPLLFDSVASLAFLAAHTERVRLGTAAIILPLRNPLVLARQLASVQDFSDGRLIIGVCLGGGRDVKEEYGMVGVPYDRRGRVMDEYLRVLRDVLFTNKSENSFHGKFVNYDNFVLMPKPKPFPIWYAGRSEEALNRAARLADGWIPGFNQTADKFKTELPILYDALKKQGRSKEGFTIALETFICLGDTPEQARSMTAETLNARGIKDISWTFIGTIREANERLEAFKRVGAEYFELKPMVHTFGKALHDMEVFAREIMPSWT